MAFPQKDTEPSSENQRQFAQSGEKNALELAGLFFLELIKVALMAGITIFLIRYFLFKPFYVKGQSMEPSYSQHDYLIIDELSYRLRSPARGEVIVFQAPLNPKDYYLKRIIGLPGERVKIENNTIVIYNSEHPKGVVVHEQYLTESTDGDMSLTLGPNEYFVLGDNRDASLDSRRFGPIDGSVIVGRIWFRGWPFDKISGFHAPQYNF